MGAAVARTTAGNNCSVLAADGKSFRLVVWQALLVCSVLRLSGAQNSGLGCRAWVGRAQTAGFLLGR
jgi:hypothetical protein